MHKLLVMMNVTTQRIIIYGASYSVLFSLRIKTTAELIEHELVAN